MALTPERSRPKLRQNNIISTSRNFFSCPRHVTGTHPTNQSPLPSEAAAWALSEAAAPAWPSMTVSTRSRSLSFSICLEVPWNPRRGQSRFRHLCFISSSKALGIRMATEMSPSVPLFTQRCPALSTTWLLAIGDKALALSDAKRREKPDFQICRWLQALCPSWESLYLFKESELVDKHPKVVHSSAPCKTTRLSKTECNHFSNPVKSRVY